MYDCKELQREIAQHVLKWGALAKERDVLSARNEEPTLEVHCLLSLRNEANHLPARVAELYKTCR